MFTPTQSTPSPVARSKKTDEYLADSEQSGENISKLHLNSNENDIEMVHSDDADVQETIHNYSDGDEQNNCEEEGEEEEDIVSSEEIETTEHFQADVTKAAMVAEVGVKKRKPRRE